MAVEITAIIDERYLNMIRDQRQSNFELLRIILMLMIVGLHTLFHGGALPLLTPEHANYYIANTYESLFIVAVNCFIIISGYFRIKGSIKKVLKIEFQILFYSISIFVIFVVFNRDYFSIKEMFRSFTPVISTQWWFITKYMALLCLSPFINILIDKIDKEDFKKLLIVLSVIFIILPTFMLRPIPDERGYGLYSFVLLYLIGAYISKYYDMKISRNTFLVIYLACTSVILAANLGLSLILKRNITFFHSYDNIFVVVSSISLFMYFRSINIYSKTVNKLGSLVFGVYLIHDHHFVRAFIYKNIFHTDKFYYSGTFAISILVTILIIFVTCSAIEFVRSTLFNGLENKIISAIVPDGEKSK